MHNYELQARAKRIPEFHSGSINRDFDSKKSVSNRDVRRVPGDYP